MANPASPIPFDCRAFVAGSSTAIAAEITDLARWSEFRGYGFLPGIEKAEFEQRTDGMVGTRIRVRNTDGSSHVEEILSWDPEAHILMKLDSFSPPLSRLASHFTEEWLFVPATGGTQVTRRFELFPLQPSARPLLWLISLFFRKAIDRHLQEIQRNFAS